MSTEDLSRVSFTMSIQGAYYLFSILRSAFCPGCSAHSSVESRKRSRILLSLVLFAMGALVGCGTRGSAEDDESASSDDDGERAPVLVELASIRRETVEDLVVLNGDLQTDRVVQVISRADGIVRMTPISEGDKVTDKTTLLELEDDELALTAKERKLSWEEAKERAASSSIEKSEASQTVRLKEIAFEKAKREHDALVKVVGPSLDPDIQPSGSGGGSRVGSAFSREEIANRRYTMEQAESELASAKLAQERSKSAARLAAIQVQLADTSWARAKLDLSRAKIVAPIAGYVSSFDLNRGELVSSGTVVATIVDTHPLHVDLRVPQRSLRGLRRGLDVRVTPETHPDREFEGKVATVAPVVDAEQGTVKVRVQILDPDKELQPGVYVTATIVFEVREKAALVPKQARLIERNADIVFVVRDGRAVRVPLSVKSLRAEHLEVRVDLPDGLRIDDEVVVRGQSQLRNGSAVKRVEREIDPPLAASSESTDSESTGAESTGDVANEGQGDGSPPARN